MSRERLGGRVAGMTLVELMVGMAVGLFVATVSIATFVSTRSLNVVNASTTRMSENGRLAMEILQADLRNAGFAGCRPFGVRVNEPTISVLNGGIDAGFITEGNSGLRGHRGTGSGFSPALTTALAAVVPAPLNNSDILSVRVPADQAALGVIASMPSNTSAPQLKPATAGNRIQAGDVVLIANCKASTIFQVTEADPVATGTLSHATGGAHAPGNSSTDLGHAYRSDATVYRLQTRHYFVAPSTLRPGTNALWRLTVPATTGGDNPLEVATGIDRLNISYGVDTAFDPAGDRSINRYQSAQDVSDWDRVLAARVEMMVATPQDGMAQAPQTIRFAGNNLTATDRRVRTVLTEVIALRNGAE